MKCLSMKQVKITSNQYLLLIVGMLISGVIGFLIGVPQYRIVGASSDGIAIIENTKTGKQIVAENNELIFGELEVVHIKDGAVEVAYQGKKFNLKVNGAAKSPSDSELFNNNIIEGAPDISNIKDLETVSLLMTDSQVGEHSCAFDEEGNISCYK